MKIKHEILWNDIIFDSFCSKIETDTILFIDAFYTPNRQSLLGITLGFKTTEVYELGYIPISHIGKNNYISHNKLISFLSKNSFITYRASRWYYRFSKCYCDLNIIMDTSILLRTIQCNYGLFNAAKKYGFIDVFPDEKVVLSHHPSINEINLESFYGAEYILYVTSQTQLNLMFYSIFLEEYKKLYGGQETGLNVELDAYLCLCKYANAYHIDPYMLKNSMKLLEIEIDLNIRNIQPQTGRINLNSTTQLSNLLFNKLKLQPILLTETGNPSVSFEALESLQHTHPVVAQIFYIKEAQNNLKELQNISQYTLNDSLYTEWSEKYGLLTPIKPNFVCLPNFLNFMNGSNWNYIDFSFQSNPAEYVFDTKENGYWINPYEKRKIFIKNRDNISTLIQERYDKARKGYIIKSCLADLKNLFHTGITSLLIFKNQIWFQGEVETSIIEIIAKHQGNLRRKG